MATEEVTKARKEMENMVVRLADELDRLINMYSWARESLGNEMTDGLAYKKEGLAENITKKLKELTIGMNSLIESKIKWDKAQKALAATMTPAEELDAVFKYIVSISPQERDTLRDKLDRQGIYKWKS